ncbi:MAG: protein-glutamate O-methyltransferase CheR [Pseudomonadota bacterium]
MSSLAQTRPSEFEYTQADFTQIKGMIYDDAGIFLPDTKMNLVYSRLARRLRVLGMQRFSEYITFVAGKEGREERGHLLSALTTNLTHFFREPHHFETIRDAIAKEALAKTARGGKYRIWSAGCSSGEEPYSLAIALLDAAPELAKRDVKVLGTDIDPVVVNRATTGLYDREVIDPVEPRLREKYFQSGWGPNADRFCVGDEVRAMVDFQLLNLMGPWPIRESVDAVMCRNVVIYFDEATKGVLWQRFSEVLDPGGWLFIGHSERLSGHAKDRFESAGLTTYRRVR